MLLSRMVRKYTLMNVMTVDCDKDLFRIIKYILREMGHMTVNFQDLLHDSILNARVENVTPDLILINVLPPYLSEWENVWKIKSNPRWQHAPIVLLCTSSSEKIVKRAQEMGIDDILSTPFTIIHFQETIARYLQVSIDSCVSNKQLILSGEILVPQKRPTGKAETQKITTY